MAFVPPKDRVLEHSTSNSQTVFAVTGAIDTSFNAFSASMSVGDTTIGYVVEPGVAFKSGILTYSASNQITIDSSSGDSKGTFSSSGTKEVAMGLPASRLVAMDGAQTITSARQIQAALNALVLSLAGTQSLTTAQQAQGRTNAGVDTATLSKSGSYTVVAADYGALIKCTGTFSLAFTTSATLGDKFQCNLRNDGTGLITLDPNGSETVDGATSKILYPGDACTIICDGSNFKTIGKTVDNATFSTLGHVTLAGGLIVQWGIDASAASDNNQTFDIAFPNACFGVNATVIALDGTSNVSYTCHVSGIGTTQFSMRKRSITGTAGPVANPGNAYWWAWGN